MPNRSGGKRAAVSEINDLRKQVADLKLAAVERHRVEAALRSADQLHRTTLDEAPIGIARLDSQGRPSYLNPAFASALGYASLEDYRIVGSLRGVFANGEGHRLVALADQPRGTRTRVIRQDGSEAVLELMVGRGSPDGVTVVIPGPQKGER